MLYVHENNFDTKIRTNYKGAAEQLTDFKRDYYLPFRQTILEIDFTDPTTEDFKQAADLLNEYGDHLSSFIRNTGVTSQSKLESTLLEELSAYIFKDIPEIRDNELSFFNKGIFAGLKINPDLTLDIIKKDVDFCIGKKIQITIENQNPIVITMPLVSVEVKTYLDATMFGEVKSSSKTLKSATPNSKAYVLMGYKDLADEHIIAARQDSTLDEMFVLRKAKGEKIDYLALQMYWEEIRGAINGITQHSMLTVPGRLLAYNERYQELLDRENN